MSFINVTNLPQFLHASWQHLLAMATRPGSALLLLLAALTCCWWVTMSAAGQTNLLVNPSFESDLRGSWLSVTSDAESIFDPDDSTHGSYVAKFSNRAKAVSGPVQEDVPIGAGVRYAFRGYAKLLSDNPGRIWQEFKVVLLFTYPGEAQTQKLQVAYRGFVQASQGWIRITGDVIAPEKEFESVKFAVRGPDAGLDFLLDDLALYEIPENTDWQGQAHTNIENFRKSNMRFHVRLPHGVPRSEIELKIDLKRHEFAFGSLVTDTLIMEQPASNYSKLVDYLFNWATVQSFKWKFNKGTPTEPDFRNAVAATDILRSKGFHVRGHSIFWNVEKNIPTWVKRLTDRELPLALYNHLDYMVNLAAGKLAHWDVQNEHISNHYYEERLGPGYANLTKEFFRHAKALDPDTTLYFNDFTGVTSGAHTEEMRDLMLQYLSEDIPVEGLGIQGHTKSNTRPDPTLMWKRLDRLAETGLELFMTEFDLQWPDDVERADWFEDAIRAFFGHPALSGVVLWGFWDQLMPYTDKELVSGDNLEFVEPGERWACLVKKEWSTHVTKNLADSGLTFDLRGFRGNYEVVVKRAGVPVQVKTFSLGKWDKTVNIRVKRRTAPIPVSPELDYLPRCISHRARRSLGVQTLSSTATAELSCRVAFSRESDLGEGDVTTASCLPDEVMTGCTSFHQDKKSTRNGEKIVMEGGVAKCKAYNGRGGGIRGVKAFARCCKLSGLTCDYRTAGPSSPMDGAQAEATCPSGYTPLGCSSHSKYPDFDGGYPDFERNSCLSQSGQPSFQDPAERSGATAFAACCTAPGLDCRVLVSRESKLAAGKQTWVACPPGYTMTGCTARADSGKSGGAKFIQNRRTGEVKCRAFMGDNLSPDSTGVKAYATCCRTAP